TGHILRGDFNREGNEVFLHREWIRAPTHRSLESGLCAHTLETTNRSLWTYQLPPRTRTLTEPMRYLLNPPSNRTPSTGRLPGSKRSTPSGQPRRAGAWL